MKDFIKKSCFLLVWIIMIIFIGTFIIEMYQSNNISSSREIAINIVNGRVIVPEPSKAAVADYVFTNFYLVIKTILYFLIPISFLLFGGVKMFLKEDDNMKQMVKIFISFSIFETIMFLPLSFFSGFYRSHLFNVSNSKFSDWIVYNLQSFIISLTISLLLFVIVYCIFKNTKHVCLTITIFTTCVSIISCYLNPVLIEPLYNDFTEISDVGLKDKIQRMTEEAGLGKINVVSVDKSKTTNLLNAYMTGIGASRKIVLWDNTINNLSEEEILCVTAHEIGHYKYHHIAIGIIIGAIETFIMLTIAIYILKAINKRKGYNTKKIFSDKNLICLYLIIIVFQFLITPVDNMISRKMEVQADTFAVEITGDKLNNALLQAKLMETNLSVPDNNLFIKAFYNDHPTTRQRIELFNNYVANK